MELTDYIRLLRKWFWLLLLPAILAAGASYVVSKGKPLVYSTSTVLTIGNIFSGSTDTNTLQTLVPYFEDLAQRPTILAATIAALNNKGLTVGSLLNVIEVKNITDTNILQITATHTNPQFAAAIADELANQMIVNSPSRLTPTEEQHLNEDRVALQSAQSQRDQNNLRMQVLQSQIAQGNGDMSTLTTQNSLLQTQIDVETANINTLTGAIDAFEARKNLLQITDKAVVPVQPADNGTAKNMGIAAAIGAIFGLGAILLAEYADNSIKTAPDAVKALGLPVLATIARYGKRSDTPAMRLITRQPHEKAASEGYRILQARLLRAAAKVSNGKTPVFVVTSAAPGEGKSTTTANIAAVMASMGRKVLLIDADLHRPTLHKIFNLKNDFGLTSLLQQWEMAAPIPEADRMTQILADSDGDALLKKMVQTTEIEHLHVIPSGPDSALFAEILGSAFNRSWIDLLEERLGVDTVLIDSPPCLAVADSALLAANLKAHTVLVIASHELRPAIAQKAKAQFDQLEVPIDGVVLNKVSAVENDSIQYYGYS